MEPAPLPSPHPEAAGAAPRLSPTSVGDLFWSFTWMALQGFGGVMAVVQRELVEKKRWMTNAEFVEDWGVAQVLPGPNVVNLSIMIGDRYFGWRGAFAALAGMLAFPLVLVLGIAVVYAQWSAHPAVAGALRGMGAVAAGLIGGTGLKLLAALRTHPLGFVLSSALAAATFAAMALLHVPLPWVLLVVGGAACVLSWRKIAP